MLPKSNSLNTGFTGCFLRTKSFVKKFISSSLMVLFISYMIVLLALGGCSSVDPVTESEPGESQEYTVTFDTGGGSSIEEVKVNSGDTLTKPSPDPVSNNYSFVGWYSDEELTEEYDFIEVVTNSFTLYAKWEKIIYTITFDTGGGSSIEEVKVNSGDTLTKPSPDPVSNNYSFVGWYSDEELTEEYDFIEVVTNSFTLYAKWEKIIYTITFDTGEGSSISSMKVTNGDTLTKPSPDPVRGEDYYFAGWHSDAGLTQEYDFSEAVTSSFTLYAKWEKIIYTITFDTGEGSSISSMKVTNGDTLTKPSSDPVRANHSFVGWYSDPNLNQVYDFSKAVVNSFTLYAKWKEIHTVTFDTDGDSSVEAVNIGEGDTLTKPSPNPTKSSYYFAGWYSDGGLSHLYDFSKAVTNSFTLYAKWTTISHTVTFDTDGGSSIAERIVGEGDTLTKPSPDPVSNNYYFAGWYSDGGLSHLYDFSKAVTNSFTIYAKWADVFYDITFDTGGGSKMAPVGIREGAAIIKIGSSPTKDTYSFAGWYSDADRSHLYDLSKIVTNSLTLYAKWEKVIHTITFDTDGGSSVTAVSVAEGDTLTKPSSNPTRSGYSFAGWYSDPNLAKAYDFSKAVVNSFTLYAKWKK